MSTKTLNKQNLAALGADRLAELVLELCDGSAALQRRARLELSAAQGATEVARDIRKRFASLRRATSFIDWRKQRAFAKDLQQLIEMIETRVAPEAPKDAFELLWSLLLLAPNIHERTDDSNGTIGAVMDDAMVALERVAPSASLDPVEMAERILEVRQDNGYGEFDGVIPALGEALGPTGLAHLKQIATQHGEMAVADADLRRYAFVDDPARREALARDSRQRTVSMILQDVADLQGDVDAYMARYTPEQLTFGTIAPDVAHRLLAAGRAAEALEIVEASLARERNRAAWIGTHDLDEAYLACLEALGRVDELKEFLWADFRATLSATRLRRYLALLADFDDIEAEEAAKAIAMQHPSLAAAVRFFLDWPDLPRAAELIEARPDELDGNSYGLLTPAANALEAEFPLAATLARRAMIRDTLDHGRSKRYGYAARHLAECARADAVIPDYKNHPTHRDFVAALQEAHKRKQGFWARVRDDQ